MTQERTAKVHSHQSQRAKPKDATDRKVVFKSVLDNPHRVPWPSVPANIQNSILANLVDVLDGVAEFHRKCCTNSRKRRRISEAAHGPSQRSAKRRTLSEDLTTVSQDALVEQGPSTLPDRTEKAEPPEILESLTYGINAVTKRLETQILGSRSKVVLKSAPTVMTTEEVTDPIRYLLVCRADVDPPILIDHLPHLVATYNVLRQQHLPPIILVTLPKGAEATLAQVIGVRRLAALAIGASSAVCKERLAIADSLSPITAPWLSSMPAGFYVQTHIKQLRTTAPRNMKAVKEARVQGKASAKAHRLQQRKAI